MRSPHFLIRGRQLTELHMTKLSLIVPDRLIRGFLLILQQGFAVKVHVGCTVEELLCQQVGVSPEYLEERVQTIFLDGNPIDDVTSAYVQDGSTIALSAALPGLAGATLRRAGYYAPLRSQISYKQANDTEAHHEGIVLLKLFNLPLKELGSLFLSQGILVNGKSLSNFFRIQPRNFWEDCQSAEVDGETVKPEKLREITWRDKYISLRVSTS
jgi:hypothetical protein